MLKRARRPRPGRFLGAFAVVGRSLRIIGIGVARKLDDASVGQSLCLNSTGSTSSTVGKVAYPSGPRPVYTVLFPDSTYVTWTFSITFFMRVSTGFAGGMTSPPGIARRILVDGFVTDHQIFPREDELARRTQVPIRLYRMVVQMPAQRVLGRIRLSAFWAGMHCAWGRGRCGNIRR